MTVTDIDFELLESIDVNPKCQFVDTVDAGEDCEYNSEFVSKIVCPFCDVLSIRFICMSHKEYMLLEWHSNKALHCPSCKTRLVASYSVLKAVIEPI